MPRTTKIFKFYNKDIKTQYIKHKKETTISATNHYSRMFDMTSKYEEKFGKDCAEFTYGQIMEMYQNERFSTYNTVLNTHSQLLAYTDYCIEHHMVEERFNHYSEVVLDELTICINMAANKKKFITYEELGRIENQLLNDSDRFIFEMLWFGCKGVDYRELSHATMHQIDMENCTFTKQDGTVVPVTERFCKCAVKANEETSYVYYNQEQSLVEERVCEYILHPRKFFGKHNFMEQNEDGSMCTTQILYSITSSLKYVKKDYLNATRIVDSGKIAFIKKEILDQNITFSDFISSPKNRAKVSKFYNISDSAKREIRKYGFLFED